MALSEPNTLFYTPTGNVDLIQTVVELLCGAHPSLDSTTQWEFIECYDGVTRQAPVGGLMADLSNNWAPGGTVAAFPSWALLRSQGGAVSAQFDVYFRIASATSVTAQLFPLGDFVPGGGTDASPTLPSVSLAALAIQVSNTTAARSLVWDEGMFALTSHNKADSSQSSAYIGEVNPINTEADDPRPFVSYESSSRWEGTWQRVSPIDDTTVLSLAKQTATSVQTVLDLPAHLSALRFVCATPGHEHGVGTARHVAFGPDLTANQSHTFGESLGVRDWVAFRASGVTTAAIRHDGTALDSDNLRTRMSYDIDLPETPTVSGDVTKPVVSNVSPPLLTQLEPVDPIQFRITDDSGNFLVTFISVLYKATGDEEVVYRDLKFTARYKGASLKTSTENGFDWLIKRVGGWQGVPTIRITAYDLAGNQASLEVS